MKFPSKLEEGIFLKRYSRFFAEIEWSGKVITAHVANTGSLRGVNVPGQPCRFSINDNPSRKLKYTLEKIQVVGGAWVGVNTATPNKIVKEAIVEGLLPHWRGFSTMKPEFKVTPETRFDFMLDFDGKKHFVEVKNVSLVEDGRALFPDSVTERGQKHLRELIRLVKEGHSAELVYTIQRDDAKVFAPADFIDARYGELFREAVKAGVRMTPLLVHLSATEVRLTDAILKVDL